MAACGNGQPDSCDDCVQVVRNTKTVQVPCTRNKYLKYTVKVPRQVTKQVPRTVKYTDFESRQKQVPYTDYRSERRTRMETQKYQVPVTTTHTRMVPVTKKVPKTVYVDVTTQVPKSYQKTTMQTKERQVPVPYYVNVPETKYRTVTEQVPVQKSKIQMDTVTKTVYDTQVRTRVVPETKIVTKQIPVYSVVPRSAPPCPSGADYGNMVVTGGSNSAMGGYDQVSHNEAVTGIVVNSEDNQASFKQYPDIGATAQFGESSGFMQTSYDADTTDYLTGSAGVGQSVYEQTYSTGNSGYAQNSVNQSGFSNTVGSSMNYGIIGNAAADNVNDNGKGAHTQAANNVYAQDSHSAERIARPQ